MDALIETEVDQTALKERAMMDEGVVGREVYPSHDPGQKTTTRHVINIAKPTTE